MYKNSTLIAFNTILSKEISRYMRIWVQTLLPPAISMTLYFIIFGNLIGERIGSMGGFSYMEYITPGIIIMAIINNSYANVVSSFFSAKFQRSIEELIVAPIPYMVIIFGFVIGGVSRACLVGIIVTVISLFFTDIKIYSWFITITVVFMVSILFSLGGLVNAIFAKRFDDISIVPTFILTPLTYLGGVFYSIDLLPDFWQSVSVFNPILYIVNAFRFGILGVSDIGVEIAFLILFFCIVFLFSLCLFLLKKGIGLKI